MLRTIFILSISICITHSYAQLKLPTVIADNMVLQQGKTNNIWGWAKPGSTVNISFNNKKYITQTNNSGEWQTKLPVSKAGVAGDMIVTCENEKQVIKNILVGEVWICSGQSNMEYVIGGYKDVYQDEIKTAKNENIRFIVLKNAFSNKESKNAGLSQNWQSIDSATILNCSAVAYFFAKKLREQINVPVGLIISSWGGTPAQAWMDTASLKAFPNYMKLYNNSIKPLDFSQLDAMKKNNDAIFLHKIADAAKSFKKVTGINYNDNGWEKCYLPGNWELQGHPDLDGIAAYRVSFTIPPGYENNSAILHLPAIDDIDSTYINGVFIGSQNVWNELRTYNVPANILKTGKNVITIWVEDDQGGGGLNEDSGNYYLQLQDQKIWLKGEAKFKILAPVEDIAPGVNFESLKTQPGVLFNAMIAPLLSYSIRGAIWYQGESNVPQYVEYRSLFPTLIKTWRKRWNQGDFPFLFVQLASYNPAIKEPDESDWAYLREAQAGALKLPNTGMAVATDIGDRVDLHPKRKKEVGDRLAANALHAVYKFKDIVPAGPMYISNKINRNSMIIYFNNIGNGLMIKGDTLVGFTIAGVDKKFIPANAIIRGNEVIITSPGVSKPKYVRYAWANAPLEANLYNKDGLPAVPFRTDK